MGNGGSVSAAPLLREEAAELAIGGPWIPE
jgi:hypothetical protein